MIGYWDAVGLDVDRHKCGATMRVSKIPVAEQQLKHHVISQVVVGRRPCWWTRDPHIRFRLTTSVPGGHPGQMGWRLELHASGGTGANELMTFRNWSTKGFASLGNLKQIWCKVKPPGTWPWTSSTDQTCSIILSYRKIPQIGWFKTPLFTPSIYHKLIFLVTSLGVSSAIWLYAQELTKHQTILSIL